MNTIGISDSQFLRMRAAATGERERLLLDTLWETGAPVSELLSCSVQEQSVQLGRDGAARRWLSVPAELAARLRLAALEHGRPFPYSYWTGLRIVRRCAEQAGIGDGRQVTPRWLRVGAIREWLDTNSPRSVQQRLGLLSTRQIRPLARDTWPQREQQSATCATTAASALPERASDAGTLVERSGARASSELAAGGRVPRKPLNRII